MSGFHNFEVFVLPNNMFSNMKRILTAIVFLGTFCSVMGQEPPEKTPEEEKVWTLRECVTYALANNIQIARSENNLRSTEVDLSQARMSTLPNLNATLSYGYNWGRSVDPVTYQYTTQELNSINPSISSNLTLFNGFRIQNTIKQTSRAHHAAEYDLQKTKNDVMLNIAMLYITVIFNKELLQNAEFQLRSSQVQLDRIRKQVEAGAMARSEQLNMEAQVATNEVNLVNQENAVALSLLQLKQALLLPASTPMDVEIMDLDVEDLILEESRDEIFAIATETMPEIKAAKLQVESSEYAVKAARGQYFPRLTLGGSINTNYSSASDRPRFVPESGDPVPVVQPIGYVEATGQTVVTQTMQQPGRMRDSWSQSEQLKDNVFRSLGLTLMIPLFNNYQTRATVQRTEIAAENTKLAETEVKMALRQNVENAYNEAVASSKTYLAAQRTVAAREEAFRMMESRYNSGAANSFEYQVSQNDLYQAQTDFTRAKFNFIFRKKVLDFYLGKPLDY
jgi:outer membrane protein